MTRDTFRTVLVVIVLVGIDFVMFGCAAMKSPTAASVNQSITTAIADAGTVATQAEQEYQAGQLPQTAAIRTAINDLGTAYNDAKSAYILELQATAAYQGAQMQQITACAPPAPAGSAPTPAAGQTPSPECQTLTVAANARKVAADNAQAQLSEKVSAMVTKTSAVKALAKH